MNSLTSGFCFLLWLTKTSNFHRWTFLDGIGIFLQSARSACRAGVGTDAVVPGHGARRVDYISERALPLSRRASTRPGPSSDGLPMGCHDGELIATGRGGQVRALSDFLGGWPW